MTAGDSNDSVASDTVVNPELDITTAPPSRVGQTLYIESYYEDATLPIHSSTPASATARHWTGPEIDASAVVPIRTQSIFSGPADVPLPGADTAPKIVLEDPLGLASELANQDRNPLPLLWSRTSPVAAVDDGATSQGTVVPRLHQPTATEIPEAVTTWLVGIIIALLGVAVWRLWRAFHYESPFERTVSDYLDHSQIECSFDLPVPDPPATEIKISRGDAMIERQARERPVTRR